MNLNDLSWDRSVIRSVATDRLIMPKPLCGLLALDLREGRPGRGLLLASDFLKIGRLLLGGWLFAQTRPNQISR